MKRRDNLSPSSSWVHLLDICDDLQEPEEDVLKDPYYTKYPERMICADMLPPDYPAIISLLCSIITICWTVGMIVEYKIESFLYVDVHTLSFWILCSYEIQ